MILSAQSIRLRCQFTSTPLVEPFVEREEVWIDGMRFTYGLGPASYDIRIQQNLELLPNKLYLASSVEKVNMPNDLAARVMDKSSWARRGVTLQNTHFDPGFCGYPTLEITNHSERPILLKKNMPIAQLVFELLDEPTEQPYQGKYQNQPDKPVEAK